MKQNKKVWAEFFIMSVEWTPEHGNIIKSHLIPALGSDAVYRVDGRYGLPRAHKDAKRVCTERKYLAYRLMSGSFSDNNPITDIIVI